MPVRGLRKLKLSGGVIALGVILLLLTLTFNNGFYLFCCTLTAYILLGLLFRRNRPGMVVFSFLLQWVQVIAYVIWMNSVDWDINKITRHAAIAVLLSCVGLVVIAVVFSLGINKIPVPSDEEFAMNARQLNERRVLILYSCSTLFLGGLQVIVGSNSGFAQILMTLSTVKWIFFMIYGFICWTTKKNWWIFAIMVLFEFTTALYSFFSNFKEVILITIAMSITLVRNVSFKQLMAGLMTIIVLIFLFLSWTAIKGDYRNFVNQGKNQQVVEVSRTEALGKITEKVGSLSWQDYQFASYVLMLRVQYILHLAKAMDRVPELLPYENGRVWSDNIAFVLEPRILFPNKPTYDATLKTVKYTGIRYAGRKQGTSFSLGYFADSYIDFGYTGMFIPLAIIGLALTGIYRLFIGMKKINILFRYTFINVVLYEFCVFEADGLYLFGRLLLLTLVYFILAKTLFPRLQEWLSK